MPLDFELSHEQQQFHELASQVMNGFANRRHDLRRQIFIEKNFPRELWQAFADAGFLGSLIPEEYGGSGTGLLPLYLTAEVIGAGGFGCALLTVTSMSIACIVRNGSEAHL